jgi:hypothetical protein
MGPGTGKAVLLLSGTLVILAVLLGLNFTGKATAPRRADLCNAEAPLPVHEVWFIDATDALTPSELAALGQVVSRRMAALPAGGKLSIVTLQREGKETAARVAFSLCKPPDGSGANPLTENRRLLEKHYHAAFAGPLHAALETLAHTGDADTSPILETLYTVLLAFEAGARERRLLLVSDLLEYSSLGNFYRAGYRWDALKEAPRIQAMQGRLRHVDVTVLLRTTARTRIHQHRQHAAFWHAYMRHAGVDNCHMMPL